MAKLTPMQSVIQDMGKGKQFPALSLIRNDTEVATLISKLVKPRNEEKIINTNDSLHNVTNINQSSLVKISESIRQNIKDNDNIINLFPDIELGMQILISSIISPKDMVTNDLNYAIKSNILPPEVSASFIEKIKEHFEGYYEFEKNLSSILRESLFTSGACIYVTIPESSVDELINRRIYSTESIKENINTLNNNNKGGFLGSPFERYNSNRISIESLFEDSSNEMYSPFVQDINAENKFVNAFENFGKVIVSDNLDQIKLPLLLKKRREYLVKNKLNLRSKQRTVLEKIISSQDAAKNYQLPQKEERSIVKRLNEADLEKTIFKSPQNETVPFVTVKTKDVTQRRSYGRPLFYKLPTTAVIPVIEPGNTSEHVGYFVLHDEEGYPITGMASEEDLNTISNMLKEPSQGMTSYLLQRARRQLDNISCSELTLDKATQIYSDIVNSDLLLRLKNGIYGSNVKLSSTNDIYRIMLARTFKNQFTRLVFIPAEQVQYFAFRYHENGIGKTLLDDMKFILSLRAILLVSRTIGSIKNSIGVTEVRFKLDDRDPDPWSTIETGIDEIMKTTTQWLPAGMNRASDLVTWAQRAGFEFSFEGHPKIPDMNLEFSQKANSHTMPDTDLEENLRKQSIQGLGLSPENVDNGFSAEFATTIVNNNILLSQRVQIYQSILLPMLERQLRILVRNDQVFYKELVELLIKNKDNIHQSLTDEEKKYFEEDMFEFFEVFIEDIMEKVTISLPTPNFSNLVNQMTSMDEYLEALDKGLDAWMNSEFITQDFVKNAANYVDEARAAVRSYYLRKFMADNNILPELSNLTLLDVNGDPALDIYAIHNEHVQSVVKSMIGYLSRSQPFGEAADKDINNIGLDGETDYTPSDNSYDSTNDYDGDSFGESDNFGLDDNAFSNNENDSSEKEKNNNNNDDLGLDDNAFK